MKESDYDRRTLLQGSLALAGVVPLCCSTPQLPGDCLSYDGNKLAIDLRSAAPLRQVGSAGAVTDPDRKLNIIVAHVEKGRFVALDRTCTHGGAMCTFNAKRRTLRCTSLNHAEYDLHGTLLHGRTHGNLRAYPVRVQGTRIEIGLEAAG
jgi:nitrite reductase/ring-hydroxylating ferredoxin subunit